jgi:hypothetical protein
MHVHGAGHSAFDRHFFIVVFQRFSGIKNGASVGKLDDYRRAYRFGCFHHSIYRIGTNHIYSGQRKISCFCRIKNGCQIFSGSHTRLNVDFWHNIEFLGAAKI